MYIDTHCHVFSEYYDDIEEIVRKCKENNVTKIIVSGCDMKSNMEVLELVNKYDIIYGTIGFHPTELDAFKEEYFNFLIDNINNNKIVGVGEIGLDYYYDEPERAVQLKWFERQLQMAVEVNKPVIIHSREACADTINILKNGNADRIGGIIHCYSYTKESVKTFYDMNFYFGIGGVLTFKNARKLVEAAEVIPMERILLETDCPYLAPVPNRGKRNDSSNIRYVIEKLAEIKKMSYDEIVDITNNNARRLFFKEA